MCMIPLLVGCAHLVRRGGNAICHVMQRIGRMIHDDEVDKVLEEYEVNRERNLKLRVKLHCGTLRLREVK